LAFEIPKQMYSGAIKPVTIGKGAKAITLGGETSYPFYVFDGPMPNPPRVAMEVWDMDPGEDWAEPAKEPFKDVLGDPVAWAQKCVKEYGADAIALILFHHAERPVGLFSLDGHPHLKSLSIDPPDLCAYRALTAVG